MKAEWKKQKAEWKKNTMEWSDYAKRKQMIGDINLGNSPWQLENMNLWLGVGDLDLDLTTAILPEGESFINLSGWVGDITVLVPDDLALQATVELKLGEAKLIGETQSGSPSLMTYKSENYDTAEKKVNLHITLSIGQVHVKRID